MAASAAAAAHAATSYQSGTIVLRFYLSDAHERDHYDLVSAANIIAEELNCRLSIVGDPQFNSIFQEFVLKVVQALPAAEMAKRLGKVFRAIAGTDSQTTMKSLRNLNKLIEESDNVVILLNHRLFVRTTNKKGQTSLVLTELNDSQNDRISQNSGLWCNPKRLLAELDRDQQQGKRTNP